MKHYYLLLAVLTLLLHGCNAAAVDNKINIEIFYESLCPDSLHFIKTQLYPSWSDVKRYANVKFIPFGKSSSLENGAHFECQHGPKECMGNRLQSCVLNNLVEQQDRQVDYVHCFMVAFRSGDEHEIGQTCAMNAGVPWPKVKECYENDLGTQLQLQAERDTINASPKFVPTILFNGKFDADLQQASLKDFGGVVCGLASKIDSNACKNRSVIQV